MQRKAGRPKGAAGIGRRKARIVFEKLNQSIKYCGDSWQAVAKDYFIFYSFGKSGKNYNEAFNFHVMLTEENKKSLKKLKYDIRYYRPQTVCNI